ncbi:MAG: fatty acid desaturase [Gammaproteobacteria bacterium]|nr:fatty acid desaturase [Gammaproteobacteria bacterium]
MGSRSGSHRAETVVNPAIGCDSSCLTPPTDIENDISQPNLSRKDLIAREELQRLRTLRNRPNVFKIPLFIGIMMGLTWAAWTTDSSLIRWSSYVALGYMWMGIVTFMHEGTHNTLFEREWANWAFGIVAMIPLMVCFVAFKEDHLEHHRYNRSPQDPDAFTMGKRGVLDFILFYAYAVAGILLSFLHFNLLYPIQKFGLRSWSIYLLEMVLRVAFVWALVSWALTNDVLTKTLEVWLVPILFFSLFNSARFIAEHYETPWNEGQLLGTRTITSNPVHSYFWNNINWHIGHHLYPSVPWYNLVELHDLLKTEIEASGAVVDKSYTAVFLKALLRGPETEARVKQASEKRKKAALKPAPTLT